MSNFYIRGVLANLVTLAILLACLFIPAGTLNYWQAWVFVAVFGVSAQALGIYFLVHDRKLVERRMNIGPVAEQRPAQKLISALFILGFVGFVVLPAFDHRFGWSPVAPVVSVIADAMIVLSFLLFFVVMKSNSYAASTIQVEEEPWCRRARTRTSGTRCIPVHCSCSPRCRSHSVRGGAFSSSCRSSRYSFGASLMRKSFSAEICQDMPSICRGCDIVSFLGCGKALTLGKPPYGRRAALSTRRPAGATAA
jgi:hypothetical protein